jgi:ascorbate PTS system EIIA or EIIAB component
VILEEYLFANETVILRSQAPDWQSAVKTATELLLRAGAVEARYYDAILENVRANGPYFVIMPGIAMPHAGPEDGGLATGFSLVTLAEPVAFGHPLHDPVDIVLCIAAADRKALSQEAIVELMTLLDCEGAVDRLRRARTLDDVWRLLADLPSEP